MTIDDAPQHVIDKLARLVAEGLRRAALAGEPVERDTLVTGPENRLRPMTPTAQRAKVRRVVESVETSVDDVSTI